MGIGKAASHRDTVVVLGTGVGDEHIEEGVRVCLETLTDLLPELCASERLISTTRYVGIGTTPSICARSA
jgi:hypothetical protein